MTTRIRYKGTGSVRVVADFVAKRLIKSGIAEVASIVAPQAITRAIEPGRPVISSTGDGLDNLDIEDLRDLAERRDIKVHHRAGRDKILAALRGED
jgi:hypothetical protein